jgi:hypothetical protein
MRGTRIEKEVEIYATNLAPPPHLRTGTDPVSEMLCFLASTIRDDGRSPRTQ